MLNVKLLEIKLDRNHFARHRLHLNFKGKEFFSHQLAVIVEQFLIKEQIAPILGKFLFQAQITLKLKTQILRVEKLNQSNHLSTNGNVLH
jgi:hypothetical protein